MTVPGAEGADPRRDHPPAKGALAESITRYQERLLARIRLMMGPAARESLESGDVLQSVYAEALRDLRPQDLQDERVFLRWLTAVARHHIVDEVRRNRERSFEALESDLIASWEPPIAAKLSAEERRQRLVEALLELDPVRQRVVELRALDGRAWQAIAESLGRSEEAARKLYHRALLELGEILGRSPEG